MKENKSLSHVTTLFMSLGSYLAQTIIKTSMRKRIVINDDMTTSFWYDWKKPMIASLCLNIGLGLSVVYMANIPEKIKHVYHSVIVSEESGDMMLTDSGLTAELVASGVVLPNVAVAQATIESGLGKSKVGREAKNLFGITYHNCKHVAGATEHMQNMLRTETTSSATLTYRAGTWEISTGGTLLTRDM
jgi:hypothetical protein